MEDLDCEKLASQVSDLGAGYFFITMQQGTRHFIAPSESFEALTGLKDGIYEVRLKGSFFPYRSTDKIESTYYGAALYAGTNEVPIVAVSEEALPESEAQNQENCYIDNVNNLPYDYTIDRDGQTFYVPAHEVGAGYAFKGGRYENVMLVNVTDGRLTVGMRVDGTVPGLLRQRAPVLPRCAQ